MLGKLYASIIRLSMRSKFKLFDAILAMVCVILVTEACSPTAAIGNSQYFWWIFLLIFFFVPYGLVSCELGTTYQDELGIFVWTKRAFGKRWANRMAYYYWVNFPIWIASVTVLFISILEQVFLVNFSWLTKTIIEIGFIAVVCFLGSTRLSYHKKIIDFGTILKIILMGGLGLIGIYTALTKGSATDFSFASFFPNFSMSSLSFLSVIVFNFIGFEIVATFRKQITNPKKEFPKIVLISGLLIAVFYMLASFGLGVAIPRESLSLDTGIIESYMILLGNNQVIVAIIGLMFIITLFVSLLSWSEGVNLQCKASSDDGSMPKIFGYKKNGNLYGASFMNFIVATLIILTERLIDSNVFWNFFALNLITLLITYLPMFLSFLKLRHLDSKINRPYMVPGNKFVVYLIAYIPTIILILSIILTLLPTEFNKAGFYQQIPIMAGTLISIIIGEIFVRKVKKN